MAKLVKATGFMPALRRWAFNKSGFNQYGLFFDDLLYETPDVIEAVNRLPNKIIDERNFRMIRAAQLSMQKIVLPKEEWITFEQDRANRYLSPIVEEVKKEREEKEKWISLH
ncbi:cytochrome b-c1 complex subunit 7-like [Arctopsyche grandis]|uniref:cytochrome b-c1 complex subunit 7-like n=1 Tax=Arctopsyche grandis TaxID=121162 RepID=UPI00406DA431